MNKYNYSKSELEKAIKESFSFAEVCRKLGIRVAGGNYKTLRDKIEIWELSVNHFTGSAWNQGERTKSTGIKINLSEILIINSTYKSTHGLKKRLIKEGLKNEKCEECGIEDWNNKKISFDLDHVNGVNNDNRIENLKILCPNCHSQTSTYKSKNIKKIEKKYPFCEVCGKECTKWRNRCCSIKCSSVLNRKYNNRPTIESLIKEVIENNHAFVGRKYSVSDNTVRKWLKKKTLSLKEELLLMKIYKAYLHQDGGCDYTIGCGNILIHIEGKSWEDAIEQLEQIIEDEYSNDESKLDNVELFEVNKIVTIDMETYYKKRNQKLDLKKELTEREHYELLKAKYGNNND